MTGVRRPAVVLILVVAVLAILFVAGAALLTQVTFSTKTLDAEERDRETRAAVTAVEESVYEFLTEGFLGAGGLPYNPPEFAPQSQMASSNGIGTVFLWTPPDPTKGSVLRLPVYGEVPGVHTWVDQIEPLADPLNSTCTLPQYSMLRFAEQRRAGIDPRFATDPLRSTDPAFQKQPLWLDNLSGVPQSNLLMDADGDAIPDSYATVLRGGMLPPDIHRTLADRLRDPNYLASDPTRDPDTLYLTLKIVPHGAMVNLNTRLPVCPPPTPNYLDTLVSTIMGYNPAVFMTLPQNQGTPRSYLPESEEWLLRNRGGMVLPRVLPPTRMETDWTQELLLPHTTASGSPTSAQLLSSVARRWWLYDPSTLNDYNNSTWRQAMDPGSGIGFYDLNHLLTTISHDDQLIRSGVGPDPDPSSGLSGERDWIEWLMDPSKRLNFAWDNYPHYLDDVDPAWSGPRDPRLGRLKFSFPYFSKNRSAGGWLPDGTTLRTLPQPARDVLLVTIQDAFFLMLRNYAGVVDFNGDGTLDPPGPGTADDIALSVTAASLTANLFDFADRDANGVSDEPTEVIVRDWRTGLPLPAGSPMKVYGLERQPYITEAYARVADDSQPNDNTPDNSSIYAIELYNPYETPIDLTQYYLSDLNTDPFPLIGPARLNMEQLDGTLAGSPTLAPDDPSRFKVFSGYASTPSGAEDLGDFGMDNVSRIVLVRRINPSGTNVDITVDHVDLTQTPYMRDETGGPVAAPLSFGNLVATQVTEFSLQRDTSAGMWRFPVPRYTLVSGANKATIGPDYDNATNPATIDPTIRPVHIDFANRGTFRQAFPTTGSMLLLMRHAHRFDPGLPAGEQYVAFNHVGNLLAEEFDQIDNGRMPVFDTAGKYHVGPSTVPGAQQGIEALPWGQLLYDYFTALPLQLENACSAGSFNPQGFPPVDLDGLRVSGRININAAPWSVLAGLPLIDMNSLRLPTELELKIQNSLYNRPTPPHRYWQNNVINPPSASQPSDIGIELAQAIVGYRDATAFPTPDPTLAGNGLNDFTPLRSPLTGAGSLQYRRGFGFLTVGELLNVRHPASDASFDASGAYWSYNIDGQEVANDRLAVGAGAAGGDYVRAVARMVVMMEWVTTKSHVFTVYGTIRGQFDDNPDPALKAASLKRVEEEAIRFQTTVDRLPMLFDQGEPRAIGSRIIGRYADVRGQ